MDDIVQYDVRTYVEALIEKELKPGKKRKISSHLNSRIIEGGVPFQIAVKNSSEAS